MIKKSLKKKNLRNVLAVVAITSLALPGLAMAQLPSPTEEAAHAFKKEKTWSPYAGRNFPTKVYFGDTHVHTGLSLDAGLFGATLSHEEAWRFAHGEEVTSSSGLPVKLGRPHDWMVITDHSDMMGVAFDIQRGAPNIVKDPSDEGCENCKGEIENVLCR